jgi:hypothetical protein
LNLREPKTLNEKINWLKLYDDNHLLTIGADKFEVRKYIQNKIGKKYLIPLFLSTIKPEDIKQANLPNIPIIIKVTHNSSGGIILKNKNLFKNWEELRNTLKWNMADNYYWHSREPQYKKIKPKLIVEKLLLDEQGNIPSDFKLHYFQGKLGFVQVDSDRMTKHKRNLYDANWQKLDCEWEYPMGTFIPKPKYFIQMKELGEIIAEDFIYVRVDFYNIGSQIYFGELTFHSDGGWGQFNPKKYDLIFGNLLNLPGRI